MLLMSFCKAAAVLFVAGAVAVELKTELVVDAAVATGVSAEPAVLPVVVVPEGDDELPEVEFDTKLKRSLTMLLMSFCKLGVVAVTVPLEVVKLATALAVE
jgi:hypothetical protein